MSEPTLADLLAELQMFRAAIEEMARRFGRSFLLLGLILGLGIGTTQLLSARGQQLIRQAQSSYGPALVAHVDSVNARSAAEVANNGLRIEALRVEALMLQGKIDQATAEFQTLQAKVDAQSKALGIRVPRSAQAPPRVPVAVPTPVEIQLLPLPPVTPLPKPPCVGPLFGLLPCGIGLRL